MHFCFDERSTGRSRSSMFGRLIVEAYLVGGTGIAGDLVIWKNKASS